MRPDTATIEPPGKIAWNARLSAPFRYYLTAFVQEYGTLTYGILFAIIFAETGLVVTPFLPGDSLLFAAGALAATGAMRIEVLVAGR